MRSALASYGTRIYATDKLQTLLTVLTFEANRELEGPDWEKLSYNLYRIVKFAGVTAQLQAHGL